MANIMEIIGKINSVLWGPLMMLLLLGTGLMYTIRLKFIQVRGLGTAVRQIFGKHEGESDAEGLSPFQSLTTAIAAQVGTGNLAGVATAIAAGGPGAVFWMWLSAFLGMSTIFSEAVLAQLFKEEREGALTGGPAYYISKGLNSKFLAGLFAIFIIIALGIMGNMVQSNSIATAFKNALPALPPVVVGIVIAVLAGLIFIGGISRIGSFTEKLVPIMAALYLIGGIWIVVVNANMFFPALKMIVYGAFNPRAATGGLIGVTIKESMRYGIARGLFSNEAGMGSTPHAHAVAKVNHPVKQGLVAMIGVIVDTFIVCTMTALVILTTGVLGTGFTGAELTQEGFRVGLSGITGNFGIQFIAITLFFFAFSTIIGWYFFGEQNVKYLFGNKAVPVYRVFVLVAIVIGTLLEVELVWSLADTFNALMVIPNLIALIGLSSLVVKSVKDFNEKYGKKTR